MDYLFDKWNKLKKTLINKQVFIFLDYDGTLTPIVDYPDKAVISAEARNLLKGLSALPKYQVGIISGRALSDIKKMVSLENITYVGNHGLEIEGSRIKLESQVSPRLKAIIRQIHEDMVSRLSAIKGVLIEDKGPTISIHYRLIDKKDMILLRNIFTEITRPFIVRHKIKIDSGKKVFEIKPDITWDKGKVILWLLAKQQFAVGNKEIIPICMGDDVTDEDAFRALKNRGITVFVGRPKASQAEYYLRDTKEVVKFLNQILKLPESAGICQNR
ncbi:MAG: trehalose-phosphatase [Candidatus Omnitrophota bacterium]|nr:trehalose-phosphatase [Candidatus Omnitrophota bacterium]